MGERSARMRCMHQPEAVLQRSSTDPSRSSPPKLGFGILGKLLGRGLVAAPRTKHPRCRCRSPLALPLRPAQPSGGRQAVGARQ